MNNALSKKISIDEELERFNKIEARLQNLEKCYQQSCSILKEQSEAVTKITREIKKNKSKKSISDLEKQYEEELISYV
jgi:uncharacterized protein YfeS